MALRASETSRVQGLSLALAAIWIDSTPTYSGSPGWGVGARHLSSICPGWAVDVVAAQETLVKNDSTPLMSRRTMFAGAGTVGALAAAAAALPLVRPEAETPRAADTADAEADGRYQATQHVLRYYQTARV
jgi:hypothetical protein